MIGQEIPHSVYKASMKGSRKGLLVIFLVTHFVLLAIPASAETIYYNPLGVEPFDNIQVLNGATCTLLGTRVEGNVSFESDGNLIVLGA